MMNHRSYYRRSYFQVNRLVSTSLFIVLSIVLTRFFSPYLPLFGSNSFRIGLGTIPIILCSIINGPIYGGITGFFADLIGALLFPSGAYLFLYSVSACLQGILPYLVKVLITKYPKSKYFVLGFWILCIESIFMYYLVVTESFKIGTSYFTLNLNSKILLFSLSLLLFTIMFIAYFLISKYLNKRCNMIKKTAISDYLIIVMGNEVLLIVIFGCVLKQIYFGVPFIIGFMTSFILALFNIPIKYLVLSLCSNVISTLSNTNDNKSSFNGNSYLFYSQRCQISLKNKVNSNKKSVVYSCE